MGVFKKAAEKLTSEKMSSKSSTQNMRKSRTCRPTNVQILAKKLTNVKIN